LSVLCAYWTSVPLCTYIHERIRAYASGKYSHIFLEGFEKVDVSLCQHFMTPSTWHLVMSPWTVASFFQDSSTLYSLLLHSSLYFEKVRWFHCVHAPRHPARDTCVMCPWTVASFFQDSGTLLFILVLFPLLSFCYCWSSEKISLNKMSCWEYGFQDTNCISYLFLN